MKEDIIFTEEDKAAMLLLIFPRNFGPSTYKEIGDEKKETRVYKALKDEGIKVFKTCITVNNSIKLRNKFFSLDSVIRKVWPFIRENLTEARLLPKGPVEALDRTYPEVAKDMRNYGLPMPEWFEKLFNP